jgi:hypothetical protein
VWSRRWRRDCKSRARTAPSQAGIRLLIRRLRTTRACFRVRGCGSTPPTTRRLQRCCGPSGSTTGACSDLPPSTRCDATSRAAAATSRDCDWLSRSNPEYGASVVFELVNKQEQGYFVRFFYNRGACDWALQWCNGGVDMAWCGASDRVCRHEQRDAVHGAADHSWLSRGVVSAVAVPDVRCVARVRACARVCTHVDYLARCESRDLVAGVPFVWSFSVVSGTRASLSEWQSLCGLVEPAAKSSSPALSRPAVGVVGGVIGLAIGVVVAVAVVVYVCCAVLCCAVLCCAVLCCAVLCCAVLCCAVLCCDIHRRYGCGRGYHTCVVQVHPQTASGA